MDYILEFRDGAQLDDVIEKMRKAKKAIIEACEALEEADSNTMNERGRYREGGGGGSRSRSGGGGSGSSSYRRGRYREDWDDMDEREMMRSGRYGY